MLQLHLHLTFLILIQSTSLPSKIIHITLIPFGNQVTGRTVIPSQRADQQSFSSVQRTKIATDERQQTESGVVSDRLQTCKLGRRQMHGPSECEISSIERYQRTEWPAEHGHSRCATTWSYSWHSRFADPGSREPAPLDLRPRPDLSPDPDLGPSRAFQEHVDAGMIVGLPALLKIKKLQDRRRS